MFLIENICKVCNSWIKICIDTGLNKKRELKNLKGRLVSSMVQAMILHVPVLVRILSW